ncbi:MAG TPA: HAD-IC family P-type ATPase [Steroidobacteraceae bacterium]|jgi:H+-transporting ATPase|nr:HAD-IC family P-type ATPase [Steroidobacteraceae bacterium]
MNATPSASPGVNEPPSDDSRYAGLTTEEARAWRATCGANVVPESELPSWRRALGKFWAPVPWMLEAAILLQFMLREYVEAGVIALLLVFNAVLAQLQEGRAQATLKALRARLALRAAVRRDERWRILPASELVPGDIVKLSLGGIVPADVRLIGGDVLLDQSMLTGESLPVEAGEGARTYAGALVRRGEALAEVTATGANTKFGRTAQLVQAAHAPSSQQRAVLRVVRNLAAFSAVLVGLQVLYGTVRGLPASEMIPLALTAVLAAIPVALPATFTLASALGARALAARGVLPTRLSAVDEAATIDVLCSDKTGTLTRNELAVTEVHAIPGADRARVLALAALASGTHGMDPVDAAVQAAVVPTAGEAERWVRCSFVPFDPSSRVAEALLVNAHGERLQVLKGAFATISARVAVPASAEALARSLAGLGHRVLGVAAGSPGQLAYVGLLAVNDPPRPDARALIAELDSMGVRTVMVTGDTAPTATAVARVVGLEGAVAQSGRLPENAQPGDYAVFAGIFPEDKFDIVRAFQAAGHAVGMCGDGANDAPALRQAQMGIAVASATDIAKSAAGIVLTEPGLRGIVDAVRCGRETYQRILTYILRSVATKVSQLLFLTVGLALTGHAILTPMLMVILMISGDFLAMSATTDHVTPSPQPNAWHIGRITLGAVALAVCNVAFCSAVLAVAMYRLGLVDNHGLRSLAALTLVLSSQAVFYVVRERRHLWSSRPSRWIVLSSALDVAIIATLAGRGILMHAVPWSLIGALLLVTAVFTLLLDVVKSSLFERLRLS